jgi:hypothetical protein
MNSQLAEQKFRTLPEDLKKEVLTFIDFLLAKRQKEKKQRSGQLNFSWEGGLSDLKKKYRSVDLQHQSMDWR